MVSGILDFHLPLDTSPLGRVRKSRFQRTVPSLSVLVLLAALGRTRAIPLIAKRRGECGSSNKDEGSVTHLVTAVTISRQLGKRLVDFASSFALMDSPTIHFILSVTVKSAAGMVCVPLPSKSS